MGLPAHEERALVEIEQYLAEDDPRLAERLTTGKRTILTLSGRAQFILGLLATYLIGLLAVIAGVTFSSVFLIGLGAAVTVSFPVAVAARAWRHRHEPDAGSRPLDRRDELAE